MHKRSLHIAIDFDEVLFDLTRSLIDYLNPIYNTNIQYEDHFSFYLEEVWGVTIDEAKKRIDDFVQSEHHSTLSPVLYAKEVTRRLQRRHTLHVVTGRCLTHKSPAEALLNEHFAEVFTGLYFTNHFSDVHKDKAISKADLCIREGMHVLIDDAPIHALGAAEKDIPVLLLDRPWNQGTAHTNITRVSDWLAIEEEIKKISMASP